MFVSIKLVHNGVSNGSLYTTASSPLELLLIIFRLIITLLCSRHIQNFRFRLTLFWTRLLHILHLMLTAGSSMQLTALNQVQWNCASQVLLKVQKASKKALIHLKDHLERSLRSTQATQINPRRFWTKQKDLKPFGLQIKISRLENYFPLKEPYNSLCL